MAERSPNPLDIDGPTFDPNMYLEKVFKECSLRQVMDLENEIVKDTQTLHSDMQTLVYENYNKFISATETIKKMKNDFKKMEDEMDLLMSNMDTITSFSDKINSNLQENRDKISHLSGIHSLLQRLQFLFKLPATLKSRMEEKNYIQATQDYLHAQRVLMQYGDMPAFQGIKGDCEEIVCDLKTELRKQFCDSSSSTKELTEAVDLLLQLEEPAKELCTGFLASSEKRLGEHMVLLKDESEQRNVDEFIDLGCRGFLSDLCLIVSSFYDMFINRVNNGEGLDNTDIFENFAAVELESFVQDNMNKFFELMRVKVESELDVADTGALVQALDRFYDKVGAGQLSKSVNFVDKALALVVSAGQKQCKAHLQILKVAFADALTKVKQALTTVKLVGQEDPSKNLSELLNTLTLTVVEKMKGVLQDLVLFINPDLTFANKSQFKDSFCSGVREGLVVSFLQYITSSLRGICSKEGLDLKIPPTFILLLSKFCLDFKNNNVQYLLSKTDEIFKFNHKKGSLKNDGEISSLLQSSAQYLLNYYVHVQGHNCSQMLRKSVETRDWLHTIEPRTVRAVMKRVVEDISAIDSTVALLYEDPGNTTGNSSDSSRKTHSISLTKMQYKSNWSSYTPSHLDSTLVSNMHKLFSERVDIFSPVDFTKVSILTGIIKISLKTFMECVRLKTFSKYGLQQIQVDTHYLQLYLWRFVADENLVHFLLDEILGSTVHRCLEPVLMEPSVVEIICERG